MWGIIVLLIRYNKSSSTGTIWFKEPSRKCGRKVSFLAWEPGGQQNQDPGDKFITLTSLTELALQAFDPEPSTFELACESSHCHLEKEVDYQNTKLRTNICREEQGLIVIKYCLLFYNKLLSTIILLIISCHRSDKREFSCSWGRTRNPVMQRIID